MVISGKKEAAEVSSLSKLEKIAIKLAKSLSQTPVNLSEEDRVELKQNFKDKEIVVLISTIGQVNYWTRVIHGLNIPPAGFSEKCDILL